MAKISKERVGTYLLTALKILNENGSQLPLRELIRLMDKRLNLSDYEKDLLEKTGNVRWESIFHLHSIGLVKAGWVIKKKGVWYLTPEGTANLSLSPKDLIAEVNRKYIEWTKTRTTPETTDTEEGEGPEIPEAAKSTAYEQAIGIARDEIRDYIFNLDPYSFQDLVAAMFRAMGYHTPFIAPKGPDGGIDILAYRDPFGTETPRIKVQVKHRKQKATVQEVRQLAGLLHKDGDTGLFVSTGGFTDDALAEMRSATRHIEKLDLDTFIDLWEDHYGKMDEEDKALLPLRKIFFLAPTE